MQARVCVRVCGCACEQVPVFAEFWAAERGCYGLRIVMRCFPGNPSIGIRGATWPAWVGGKAYGQNSEAVPRMHPRCHLPHENGECKDVGLERHEDTLRIRRFATAHVTARDPAGTWSCSGDMKAGVPLKPVLDKVSTRFSTRATPADRIASDPTAARESSKWAAHRSRRCTFQSNHAFL